VLFGQPNRAKGIRLLPPAQLDFGALVGVVEVVGCVPVAQVEGDPFAVGPWCWLLAGARPIRPVPFKGQVALFRVPHQLVGAATPTPGG
jgi:hypothetical protein